MPAPQVRSAPLVGRETELARLREAIADAIGGSGSFLSVEGEPGIGKTRLVEASIEIAREEGMAVFSSRASELQSRFPFAPLVNALDAARAVPEGPRAAVAALLRPADPEEAVEVVSELPLIVGLEAVLEHEAAARPVVLAIEDIHWADSSTLAFLERLTRHIATLPVLVLLSCRPQPRSPELLALLKVIEKTGARIRIPPLSAEAVYQLLLHLLEAAPGERLQAQAARAGGNPLFLVEIVEVLEQAGMLRVEHGRCEVDGSPKTPTLTLTILQAVSFLPSETITVLRVASVFGTDFHPLQVAAVMGRPAATLMDQLREALEAEVLVDRESYLSFRHDVIREALYHDLPESLRTALHHDAAAALARQGAPPQQIAEHVLRSARPGDQDAVDWLRRAARDAGPRAPAVAADLLERAVDLLPDNAPERDEIRTELVEAYLWAGKTTEALALAQERLRSSPSAEEEARLRIFLVRALLVEGRSGEALPFAMGRNHDAFPEAEEARLAAERAFVLSLQGDAAGARTAADTAIELGASAGDARAMSAGLAARATLGLIQGTLPQALRDAEESVQRGRVTGDPTVLRHGQVFIAAAVMFESDQAARGEEHLREFLTMAEKTGTFWLLPTATAFLSWILFNTGRWDDALVEHEAAIDIGGLTGRRVGAVASYGAAALMALHRDRLDEAWSVLEQANDELLAAQTPLGVDSLMWARAMVAEASGRPDEALGILRNVASIAEFAIPHALRATGCDIVRLEKAVGDHGNAEAVAERMQALAQHAEAPTARAAALRARGLASEDPDLLVGAVEGFRGGPRIRDLASACSDAAEALRGAGRAEEATPLLEEAIEIWEAVGAVREVARLESSLRAAGVRRGSRTRRVRASSGWEALTETELRVAAFIAQGLSNPEIAERMFVSRNTVRTHVGHILAKLGLRSRVELAAEAIRRSP